jgi:hypothetical protein
VQVCGVQVTEPRLYGDWPAVNPAAAAAALVIEQKVFVTSMSGKNICCVRFLNMRCNFLPSVAVLK